MAATSSLLLSLFILSVLRFGDTKTPLITVIEALEKLVGFYKSSYQGFNVDGLFGLRVVEGHLQLLLEEYNKGDHQHLASDVVERLRHLVREATHVSNQALEYVRKDDETYFNNFKFLIGSPWAVYKKHRGIDPNLKWMPSVYQAQKDETLDEEMSDWCMGEMTGASHKYGRSCVISDSCVKTMTQRGYTEYSLTHQILWTMVAERAGCMQELKGAVSGQGYVSVEQLQLDFCTNNYYEMLAVVHIYMKGVIKEDYQDLFLEQQFVCPSIGFYEHLSGDYLNQILSWQMKAGCFGESDDWKKNLNFTKTTTKMPDKSFPNQENKNFEIQKAIDKMGTVNQSRPLKFESVKSQLNKNSINLGKPPQNQLNLHQNQILNQNINQKTDQRQGVKEFQQQHPIIRPNNLLNDQGKHENFRQRQDYRKSLKQQALNANLQGNNLQNLKNFQPPNVGKSFNPSSMLQKNTQNMGQPNAPRNMFGNGNQPYSVKQQSRRKLLVEKRMSDGCFSHKTAVAAGALAMYLRYIIDPGPMDLNATHRVLPESSRSLLQRPDISLGDSQKVKKEGLIPVKGDKLNEEELAINQMAALEDRDGEDLGPDGDGGDAGEEEEDYDGDEEEEEGEGDEGGGDEDGYEEKEMYPDKAEDVQDRKIVHFGADQERLHRLANMGDGLIDHMKEKGDNGGTDDVEYTYYEENEKEDKNIPHEDVVKKDTHVKSHHRIKSHNHPEKHLSSDMHETKGRQEPLEKTMFIVFSVCFLFLFFLMYRFIKKRRIHIRYHPRTSFM